MSKLVVASVVVVCALLSRASGSQEQGDIELEIAQGKLVGEWRFSYSDRPYGAFEGIPYARSPVGKRRFRDPQRVKKWYGVWLAKKLPNMCVQWYDNFQNEEGSVIGNEDCLYLNVYSSTPRGNAKLPVIVYIHGGAFIFGSGVNYGPRFIMDHEVVLVTINYRLGVLGFMSTQDAVLPGNLGLKDQSMALRWVKDNIHHFGGNPRSVTIAGMSAGGASVHMHMLSAMSKGLFHKAISMSGTALCPWVLQEAPLQKAQAVGAALGCPTAVSKDMLDCLRHRPAVAIVKAVRKLMPYFHAPFSPVAAVVEPFNAKDNFLSAHPYQTMYQGNAQDIPWMVSETTEEGLYPAAIYAQKPEYMEHVAAEWSSLAPAIFDFNYTLPAASHEEAAKKINDFYFNGQGLSRQTFSKFVEAISDRMFKIDIEKAAQMRSLYGKAPVYFYVFAYRGATSLSHFLSQTDYNFGVSHGDDTGYVMETEYMDPTTTQEDISMIKRMTQIWISFAKDGLPGDKSWPSVRKENFCFLHITDPEATEVNCNKDVPAKNSTHVFWSSLPFRENENYVGESQNKEEL